jgi:hypothetical protein
MRLRAGLERTSRKGDVAAEWAYDRELRLLRGKVRGRRPKPTRAQLLEGVNGILASRLNNPHRQIGEHLRKAYARDGWPGLVLAVLVDDATDSSWKPLITEALRFWQWGWVIDRCTHPRPHPQWVFYPRGMRNGRRRFSRRRVPPVAGGEHWYVRPARGRRPEACFLVQATARTYRKRLTARIYRRKGR